MEGNVAVYRKRRKHWSPGNFVYEVIKVTAQKPREAFGVKFEAGERYPASEEWGILGWAYPDFTSALKCEASLIVAQNGKRGDVR